MANIVVVFMEKSAKVKVVCPGVKILSIVRETFKAYDFKIAGKEDGERFSQVKKLYSFVRKGKVEKFYTKYFACVVSKASEYFPRLPFQSSVLLGARLADKIASFKKHFDSNMASENKSTASMLK